MSSVLSNWLGNSVLEAYFRTSPSYLALHTYDPGVLGDIGSEVAGGGYTRQLITWTAPGSKTIGNSAIVKFLNMPGCVVTHYAVWTAVSGGNLLVAVDRDDPLTVASNQEVHIPAADLAVTL